MAEPDPVLEQLICELALRLSLKNMREFDDVWEAANRVCDRYQFGRAA